MQSNENNVMAHSYFTIHVMNHLLNMQCSALLLSKPQSHSQNLKIKFSINVFNHFLRDFGWFPNCTVYTVLLQFSFFLHTRYYPL